MNSEKFKLVATGDAIKLGDHRRLSPVLIAEIERRRGI